MENRAQRVSKYGMRIADRYNKSGGNHGLGQKMPLKMVQQEGTSRYNCSVNAEDYFEFLLSKVTNPKEEINPLGAEQCAPLAAERAFDLPFTLEQLRCNNLH